MRSGAGVLGRPEAAGRAARWVRHLAGDLHPHDSGVRPVGLRLGELGRQGRTPGAQHHRPACHADHHPPEADGTGATGSLALQAKSGWDGTLTTALNGLYAGTARTGTLTGTSTDSFTTPPSPLPASAARTEITVPEGTALARVVILSSDHLAGTDTDLWVFDEDGTLPSSPTSCSGEYVDLTEPGTYEVYVNQFALPEGATSQTYTLHTWLIGQDSRPDRPATVTPVEQRVALGGTADVTVSWRDLPTGHTYLGPVGYGDGTETVGSTVLTVTP